MLDTVPRSWRITDIEQWILCQRITGFLRKYHIRYLSHPSTPFGVLTRGVCPGVAGAKGRKEERARRARPLRQTAYGSSAGMVQIHVPLERQKQPPVGTPGTQQSRETPGVAQRVPLRFTHIWRGSVQSGGTGGGQYW